MTAKNPAQASAKATSRPLATQATASEPGDGKTSFPIVGIGASAGGLAAFEAFFSGMSQDTDPGMAFVLVQHLDPDHKSILSELIRRYTRMQVYEVEDGMLVQANCVYIIPPNHDMALLNGTLQLLEPNAPRGQRLPIDFFFSSLAQDQHERAIGIVLSGTGSDGSQGVRAIKAEGGMVMVQTPESTEFDGMPRSAMATGGVDFQLTPKQMPAQLHAYAMHAFGNGARPPSIPAINNNNALKKIFILLRAQTGHDFSNYKPSTIHRRIERRMAVHQIDSFDTYVKYLQQTPTEVETLFGDLLIGVTNFFRDPEAFAVLEQTAIPKLFENKPAGAVVRVWVTGCSTGEEAYSIAILLQERIAALKTPYTVQIFATDIDSRAITTARAGLFPASIATDVSPERLARFFTVEPDGSAYRIHKSTRDLMVFSEHDLIKDPPFSKLDLITCRNLLIYMNVELQRKIIPLFHYALKPGGLLFLGTSEGIGEFDELFAVLDRKAKLYQRKDNFEGMHRITLSRLMPLSTLPELIPPRSAATKLTVTGTKTLRELTEQALLLQWAPASALVNARGDILYLHGRTGMFLEPSPGEAGVNNILKMAREGLRRDLTTALLKVVNHQETVQFFNLNVKTNGHFTRVNLNVSPVKTPSPSTPHPTESSLYLVVLEEAPPLQALPMQPPAPLKDSPNLDAEARIAALQLELRSKDEYLQTTHEELESSNEELKSSNEEMQSVNEELQSTNEEMETSREELQSVNEELATVNTELQTKVVDLSRANNDMNNLLAGTGIGTVFVDHQLRILRFTPAASQIINLIPSDMGRPVAHIVSNLVGYNSLVADVQAVLNTLVAKAVDVQTQDGRWYTLRIQPYRTLDNVIEGAVITFIDVSELKQAEAALRQSSKDLMRMAVVVRDASDAITVQDLQGQTLAWNPGATRLYGWTEAQALKLNAQDRIPEAQREGALDKLAQLSRLETLQPYRTQRLTKTGEVLDVSVITSALVNEAGQMYAIATTERLIQGDR